MVSPFHRGDFHRARRGITIARLELEVLEQRAQLAYKWEEIPAATAADISLARLMADQLEQTMRVVAGIEKVDYSRYYSEDGPNVFAATHLVNRPSWASRPAADDGRPPGRPHPRASETEPVTE